MLSQSWAANIYCWLDSGLMLASKHLLSVHENRVVRENELMSSYEHLPLLAFSKVSEYIMSVGNLDALL